MTGHGVSRRWWMGLNLAVLCLHLGLIVWSLATGNVIGLVVNMLLVHLPIARLLLINRTHPRKDDP